MERNIEVVQTPGVKREVDQNPVYWHLRRKRQAADLERGMAALQAQSLPVQAEDDAVTDIDEPVLLSDGTPDRTPPASHDPAARKAIQPRGKQRRARPLQPTAKYRVARPPKTIPSARQAAERRHSINSRPPLENPSARLARPTNALAIVKKKLKQNAARYGRDKAKLKEKVKGGFVRGPRISTSAPASSSASSDLAAQSKAAPRASLPTRYSDATSSSSPRVVLTASAGYREFAQAKKRPKIEEQKCKDEGQLPEKRVHPRDPKQRPDTFDGYLAFARQQRFPTDAEAVQYAEKMWQESFVHYSSDIPEGP